jgi:hypothetical protein
METTEDSKLHDKSFLPRITNSNLNFELSRHLTFPGFCVNFAMEHLLMLNNCNLVEISLKNLIKRRSYPKWWCSTFVLKESDAQVRRLNTFYLLQTIRKGPLNFRFCMKEPLRFPNFSIIPNLFIPNLNVNGDNCN